MLEMLTDVTDLLGVPVEALLAGPILLVLAFHLAGRRVPAVKVDARGRSVDFKRMAAEATAKDDGLVWVIGAGLLLGLGGHLVLSAEIAPLATLFAR
jgi:hypothetical protein